MIGFITLSLIRFFLYNFEIEKKMENARIARQRRCMIMNEKKESRRNYRG
jgi:hypothetical protein